MSGPGVCWADVDRDGYDDLFFVNHPYWDEATQLAKDPQSKLYHNLGDGTFRDVTAHAGLADVGWGQGCAFGDYDADGFLDLYIASYEADHLYHNQGDGSFRDVTAAAGVLDEGKCGAFTCWGTSATWFDYDRDDDLDLYVTNYVEWDRVGRAGPSLYPGQGNLLYRNDGDGTFTDVTAAANASNAPAQNHAKDLMAIVNDVDRDGWLDLYVAGDTSPNGLLRNNGDGTFTDIAAQAGVADSGASMGLEFEDLDGDHWPDLYMTHSGPDHNSLYLNNKNGTFTERSGEGELADDAAFVGWGTGFYDFDHDGDRDLYAFNGHFRKGTIGNMTSLFFRQDGPMRFVNDTETTGTLLSTLRSGRGSAVADYDWDGDLDLALNNNLEQRGELGRASGVTGHWVHVLLRQPGENPDGVGAEVRIRAAGVDQVRRVKEGSSYMSQDALAVHAGLGDATVVDVEVTWPDGAVEAWNGLAADAVYRLPRGGSAQSDTLGPRVDVELHGERGRGGWWREVRGFTAAAQDRAVGTPSGVAGLSYLDPATASWRPHQGFTRLALADGKHRLHVLATDAAGNVGGRFPTSFGLDGTPPVMAPRLEGREGQGGWWRGPVTVTLDAHDATSGLVGVVYSLDHGDWRPALAPVVVEGQGYHLLAWRALDLAGNEASGVLGFRIDATPPLVQVASGLPVLVALGPTEVEAQVLDLLSGVGRVEWTLDGVAMTGVDDPRDRRLRVTEPGLHEVVAVATDGAGNPSKPTPPLRLLLLDPSAWVPVLPLALVAAATGFSLRCASRRR